MSTPASSTPSVTIERIAAHWILRRDAGLTAAEQAEFARWRAEDPRHADAVARKETAWAALDRPLTAGQAGVLLERLAARTAIRRQQRIGGMAAALLLIASVGIFWPDRPVSAPALVDVRSVVIRPETRTLSDGSVVELRAGAAVATDFSGVFRRVTLQRGEAHFQVAKDAARPFVVSANGVEVRAVGTAFSIQLGSAQVHVLVTEGRVAVEQSDATDGAASNRTRVQLGFVDAGASLVVDLAPQAETVPGAIAVPAAEMAERLAWRAPKLEFSELPLGEAVALMNRHSAVSGTKGVHFVVDDSALARLRVSGIIRADNTETFVRLLEGAFGVRAQRSGDTIVLTRAGP
ncbi:MAG: DUF4880 domain-containing protein [Opitutus sp.]|nr:DUF4880 domain-containing protein [Opitutus sp.]